MATVAGRSIAAKTSAGVRVVRALDVVEWREFVARHPHGNVFQTPEMFEVFRRTKGYTPELWAAIFEGEVRALMVPVRITLGSGPLSLLTTRAVAFGGVLADPTPGGKTALAEMLRSYRESTNRRVQLTELRNLFDVREVQGVLEESGFAYEDHLNYLVDLRRTPEEILDAMGQRTRKQIRRGLRKAEVTISEATRIEEIAICYELLRSTYASAHVPLSDQSLFEAAFDILRPLGMAKFMMAWIGEVCVAASVELPYRDTIFGWYGATNRSFVAHTPTEILMWQVLKWGAENGYRLYDFGGAGKPTQEYGVRDFKAKFGGELVCFGRNTCAHSPRLLAMSKLGYFVARKLVWR